MAERVVDALEVVEVADDERERRAAVLEALLEAAAVAQAGERVVLGELAQALELAGAASIAPTAWLANARSARSPSTPGSSRSTGIVGPQEAEQRAVAVAQRHHQPVVVPGARAAPVVCEA